ncbi:MAG: pilus assembly protein PilM [Acutalibacteraceae bacterium]|jgi:type IV pilus assembly protein PilM
MLSIDIGSKKVCVVEGRSQKGSITVDFCKSIEFEEEVVSNGKIVNRPAVSFLINEIIKTNKIKSKAAVVTINNSDIIVRDFTFPQVKKRQLRQLVNSEMLQVVGTDSNFIIDFTVNGVTDNNMLSVKAYAVSEDIIESYFSLIKELKLKPYAMDLHANSISKLFLGKAINGKTQENSSVILADIGYSQIIFHGFKNGKSQFCRTENSPVQSLVTDLSSATRSEFGESEAEKLDFSPDAEYESSIVADACKFFVHRLSEAIQRYILYNITTTQIEAVSHIYIYGGIAAAKGLDIMLSDLLKVPVEVVKNVEGIVLPDGCRMHGICNAVGALIRE